ncbi:hypothetical protein [Streptomyces griseorubiginosus]|uniref:hypothetical protein n=1 Tax=Streptomyces griseorubiginosus TaxID=67304 RepID=UPI003656B358
MLSAIRNHPARALFCGRKNSSIDHELGLDVFDDHTPVRAYWFEPGDIDAAGCAPADGDDLIDPVDDGGVVALSPVNSLVI